MRGQRFSEPIPRKGTETVSFVAVLDPSTHGSFSEPIPRKGTETSCVVIFGSNRFTVFQNLFPARGRKRPITFFCLLS